VKKESFALLLLLLLPVLRSRSFASSFLFRVRSPSLSVCSSLCSFQKPYHHQSVFLARERKERERERELRVFSFFFFFFVFCFSSNNNNDRMTLAAALFCFLSLPLHGRVLVEGELRVEWRAGEHAPSSSPRLTDAARCNKSSSEINEKKRKS
jgi:hypothetical protein